MKKKYYCGNCGIQINEYRFKYSDRLCPKCWSIIYGKGKFDISLDEEILGYRQNCDIIDDERDDW